MTERAHAVETSPGSMLTGPQVAELLGIQSATWRGYVRDGLAPAPDDVDTDAHPRRRNPRWSIDSVRRYRASRTRATLDQAREES